MPFGPKCYYCRTPVPKNSIQGWQNTPFGWKRLCRGCNFANPDRLPNQIAERERRIEARKQRQQSYKERRRRYPLDTGGWKHKKGKKQEPNPKQGTLF